MQIWLQASGFSHSSMSVEKQVHVQYVHVNSRSPKNGHFKWSLILHMHSHLSDLGFEKVNVKCFTCFYEQLRTIEFVQLSSESKSPTFWEMLACKANLQSL